MIIRRIELLLRRSRSDASGLDGRGVGGVFVR